MSDRSPGEPDFRALFEGGPGLYMVLDPDLRIVAASDAYLQATLTRRDEIVGRHVFEVFPDNPDDPSADPVVSKSLASFRRVLRTGNPDVMGLQRHDVRRPDSEGGGFELRYWSAVNSPVLGPDGSVVYILHRVENVTEFVLLKQQGVEQIRMTDEARERAVRMEADLYARSREMAEASRQLKALNETLEERVAERTESLREVEERFRSVLDNSRDAIYRLNVQTGRYEYISPASEAIVGYSPDELVALDRETSLSMIHPDDLPAMRGAVARLATTGEGEAEYRQRIKSGEYRWISNRMSLVRDGAGRPLYRVGNIRDVTATREAGEALRDSEERFRALYEHSQDAIVLSDPRDGGRILSANPAACRMLGWTEAELVGQGRDVLFDLADPRTVALLQERNSTGAAFAELIYRRRDGSTFPGEVTTALFTDSRGDERAVAIIRDATDRRQAEKELRTYADDLGRSNEELQRFAYVASHDLQEPLRSIVSFSQLLARRYKGRLDKDADDYIEFIVEGGNRMQTLIRDLLQLSRVETQAKPLRPTDAAGVAASVVRAMETRLAEAGATVMVGDLPVVMADEAQLVQVIANLIGNAVKYRRKGAPPKVRVSAERRGDWFEFAVADNGIGIEAEYFDRIFEMFRRLHTHDKYEGTGIGLAVVKRIVERHGGEVRVESVPDEGSTFFFTLQAA